MAEPMEDPPDNTWIEFDGDNNLSQSSRERLEAVRAEVLRRRDEELKSKFPDTRPNGYGRFGPQDWIVLGVLVLCILAIIFVPVIP